MAVVQEDREVREAARAVAHALRPAHAEAITRLHGDPEDAIATSMRENWHTDRTVAFCSAAEKPAPVGQGPLIVAHALLDAPRASRVEYRIKHTPQAVSPSTSRLTINDVG